ncbi:hypothetical protein AB395_00004670 (plasmid) [Sinorhizobium fredii CCBAU 45436]|nr:hypothetical protein AB395_00004670 [Sinorhizobium fredii CCBAU 45436]
MDGRRGDCHRKIPCSSGSTVIKSSFHQTLLTIALFFMMSYFS